MKKFPISPAGKEIDPVLVGYVAQLMEISEFELFRRAWEAWHGEKIGDAGIEPHFNRYLDFNEVPFWVRSFVRDFLSDEVIEKERERATLSSFIFYAPLLVFLLLFILIAVLRK